MGRASRKFQRKQQAGMTAEQLEKRLIDLFDAATAEGSRLSPKRAIETLLTFAAAEMKLDDHDHLDWTRATRQAWGKATELDEQTDETAQKLEQAEIGKRALGSEP